MKAFLLFLLLPLASICQSSDPETIIREREQREKERQEKEDAKNTFPFPKDSITGNIKYSAVISIENASAQDLYCRARLFIADVYKSGKDVTQLNDDAAKIVVGNGAAEIVYQEAFGPKRTGFARYQIKIECKDNRYRYTIDGLTFKFVVNTGYDEWPFILPKKPGYVTKKSWYNIQESTDLQIKRVIELLKKGMNTSNSDF